MKTITVIHQFLTWGRLERMFATETQAKYRECFQSWILPWVGERDIEDIQRGDVLRLREAMADRHLSPARQSSILATWKSVLRFARSVLHLQASDPAEISLPRIENPHPIVLTDDDLKRLFAVLNLAKFSDMRFRALCELILGTGVRISEALRMDSAPFRQGETELDILGKGGKRRTIYFSNRSRGWVQLYLAKRADAHPALFITTGDSPRRLSRADVSKLFASVARRAEFAKPFTPHILRHTYCTTLLNNGTDISFIKELAGHADIQTTARYYLGIDKQALRRIVNERLKYHDGQEAPPAIDTKSVSS